MNINATFLGQIYMIWAPVYFVVCLLLVKQFRFPKVILFVGIILTPFIPIAVIYLMALAIIGLKKNSTNEATQS